MVLMIQEDGYKIYTEISGSFYFGNNPSGNATIILMSEENFVVVFRNSYRRVYWY